MLIGRGILDTVLLVSLFFLAPLLAPPRPAVAADGVVTAPAVAPEETGAAQSWKFRLEFKELNLQLVGVSTFKGGQTCYIKHPGSA